MIMCLDLGMLSSTFLLIYGFLCWELDDRYGLHDGRCGHLQPVGLDLGIWGYKGDVVYDHLWAMPGNI